MGGDGGKLICLEGLLSIDVWSLSHLICHVPSLNTQWPIPVWYGVFLKAIALRILKLLWSRLPIQVFFFSRN